MHITEFWAGDDASYGEYQAAIKAFSGRADQEDQAPSSLFDLQGSLGIVPVKGPLTNRDSWFNAWQGITSYTDIRNAIVQAANHPEVQSILLSVDSGGGAADGMFDAANLIRYVHDNIKPVYAHTSGRMASAAYGIGSAAGNVFASPGATVGSIGTMVVHFDASEAYKNEGVKPTVFRSGEWKALGTEYEPLSQQAKTEIQRQVDALDAVFVGHVAQMRAVPEPMVREHMGQGKVFIGQEAKQAGLIDGVMTLDEAVQHILASQPPKEGQMARQKRLTPQTIAAIEAGIDVEAAIAATAVEEDDTQETQAADPAPTPPPEEPPAQPPMAAVEPLANPLEATLNAKLEQIATLMAENSTLKAENERLKAFEKPLREVVQARINHLQVAMGQSPMDQELLASLPIDTLLKQHDGLQAKLHEAFPVGAKAKRAQTEAVAAAAPADQEVLAATRVR